MKGIARVLFFFLLSPSGMEIKVLKSYEVVLGVWENALYSPYCIFFTTEEF